MTHTSSHRSAFLSQTETILQEHLGNENFGVSELAEALHMSRSNLLRKIKKETGLSASQFIRQVRLQESLPLLKEGSMTVSEVSFKVGFGSPSYFIKCFREHYGFPPGALEEQKETLEEVVEESTRPNTVAPKQEEVPSRKKYLWLPLPALLLIGALAYFLLFQEKEKGIEIKVDRSIAVLPFKNESADSTNLYFVNGLMASALNNLQKIEDLRVVSRTSVEKYRKTDKSIPDIAKELQVNYLVEGSGQKIGKRVLLNIQLVDAANDTPLWTEQYDREVVDIFELQNDVAQKIAKAIEAVITPAELEQIEKRPTDNLAAYDYYLQALDPYQSRTEEGLEKAIPLFEKAISEDPKFAMAYADLAISYYFLDINRQQKQYTERINKNADKALLYDSRSDLSLIAKALYYIHTGEYRLAVPHLEKALEYNPNSAAVVQVLSSIYNNYLPDTAKYLKYALMGSQLEIGVNDSITQSYIYLGLSDALAQSGFTEEAMTYMGRCTDFDPNNYYAPYLKAFIQYAKDEDLERAKNTLIREFKKDTTRLDLMQEVGKLYYFQGDYEGAFPYYKKFTELRKSRGLTIYPHEDLKIGIVYEKMGLKAEAKEFVDRYADYCAADASIYKSASTAFLYLYQGKTEEAMEQLKAFATRDHYKYWILLFLEKDPLIKGLQQHPEYQTTIQQIHDRFWENQKKLRTSLEKSGLL
ncbi:helix-turn-helix domain-containing protein [Robertkochia sediminum]|uniref:helix-turn-helix domain-containing protein n=1 Tax=Robertkochia sediminum TaxID=2785326 RepID=UPI001933E3BE|nr:helix-turn-helix domain-containing protein [Robertkochia sediminum]MBL7472021.1 helix-turn-helix domain-containing protein [Robertkochia sediminum]